MLKIFRGLKYRYHPRRETYPSSILGPSKQKATRSPIVPEINIQPSCRNRPLRFDSLDERKNFWHSERTTKVVRMWAWVVTGISKMLGETELPKRYPITKYKFSIKCRGKKGRRKRTKTKLKYRTFNMYVYPRQFVVCTQRRSSLFITNLIYAIERNTTIQGTSHCLLRLFITTGYCLRADSVL